MTVGRCEHCPIYTHPDINDSYHTCISDVCDYSLEILLPDGTCSTCGPYTHPDEEGKNCIEGPCDYYFEVLIENGYCEPCGDYTHPNVTDKKTCITDVCDFGEGREILLIDGRCQ